MMGTEQRCEAELFIGGFSADSCGSNLTGGISPTQSLRTVLTNKSADVDLTGCEHKEPENCLSQKFFLDTLVEYDVF